jgi:hypothetical protein
VVLHVSPQPSSLPDDILDWSGGLTAKNAGDFERLASGPHSCRAC